MFQMHQGKSMKQTQVKGKLGRVCQQVVNLVSQPDIWSRNKEPVYKYLVTVFHLQTNIFFYKYFVIVFHLNTNIPLPSFPF